MTKSIVVKEKDYLTLGTSLLGLDLRKVENTPYESAVRLTKHQFWKDNNLTEVIINYNRNIRKQYEVRLDFKSDQDVLMFILKYGQYFKWVNKL